MTRLKTTAVLVLITAAVALLAQGALLAPRLFSRPANQELRRAPDEPAPTPETVRKRAVRPRPVSA